MSEHHIIHDLLENGALGSVMRSENYRSYRRPKLLTKCRIHHRSFEDICVDCEAENLRKARAIESEKVMCNSWWKRSDRGESVAQTRERKCF